MVWAGWVKSRAPRAGAPSSRQEHLCTWMILLIDVQILGCELHRNAFGGRALPGPAGGAIALPQTLSRYKGRGEREGEGNGWE